MHLPNLHIFCSIVNMVLYKCDNDLHENCPSLLRTQGHSLCELRALCERHKCPLIQFSFKLPCENKGVILGIRIFKYGSVSVSVSPPIPTPWRGHSPLKTGSAKRRKVRWGWTSFIPFRWEGRKGIRPSPLGDFCFQVRLPEACWFSFVGLSTTNEKASPFASSATRRWIGWCIRIPHSIFEWKHLAPALWCYEYMKNVTDIKQFFDPTLFWDAWEIDPVRHANKRHKITDGKKEPVCFRNCWMMAMW